MIRDTTAGAGAGRSNFPPTRQSAIIALRSGSDPERRRALDTLTGTYWKPVYKYIRLHWHRDSEAAQDLTQSFFLAVLERDFFHDYDPARARFRTFLRTCLDRFIMNEDRAAGRQKRGGAHELVSLDFGQAESEIHLTVGEDEPDRLFELEFVRSLLSGAVDTLRQEYHAGGKQRHFDLFDRYDLHRADSGEKLSYGDLAGEFGLTIETVTNHLAAARRDFRRIVLDRLRAMTASEEEFREEVRTVLGIDPA